MTGIRDPAVIFSTFPILYIIYIWIKKNNQKRNIYVTFISYGSIKTKRPCFHDFFHDFLATKRNLLWIFFFRILHIYNRPPLPSWIGLDTLWWQGSYIRCCCLENVIVQIIDGCKTSLGIAPTQNCTNFFIIGFLIAGGGFYSYFIYQGNKLDKERNIVRKNLSFRHRKRFNTFSKR